MTTHPVADLREIYARLQGIAQEMLRADQRAAEPLDAMRLVDTDWWSCHTVLVHRLMWDVKAALPYDPEEEGL